MLDLSFSIYFLSSTGAKHKCNERKVYCMKKEKQHRERNYFRINFLLRRSIRNMKCDHVVSLVFTWKTLCGWKWNVTAILFGSSNERKIKLGGVRQCLPLQLHSPNLRSSLIFHDSLKPDGISPRLFHPFAALIFAGLSPFLFYLFGRKVHELNL